jgi:hypothetical protein
MKRDEYILLTEQANQDHIHPKRKAYILKKWQKKGWADNSGYTKEFYKIQIAAFSSNDHSVLWHGRVVQLHRVGIPHVKSGILWHNGRDVVLYYAYHNRLHYYYLGDRRFPGVNYDRTAYIELHPSPDRTWTKLNHVAWRDTGIGDRFHLKTEEGICRPWCQCKSLISSLGPSNPV